MTGVPANARIATAKAVAACFMRKISLGTEIEKPRHVWLMLIGGSRQAARALTEPGSLADQLTSSCFRCSKKKKPGRLRGPGFTLSDAAADKEGGGV